MGSKKSFAALLTTYFTTVSLTCYFFMIYTAIESIEHKKLPETPKVLRVPIESKLREIDFLTDLSSKGKYPGTNKTRSGRRGPIPIWSQRTAILYYNRRIAGDPIRWMSLSMGVVSNAKNLVSNKKIMRRVWEELNPVKFSEMKRYLPKTWSSLDSFEADMEEGNTYVYKPVLGSGGDGIVFRRGDEMVKGIREKESRGDRYSWVVQDFIHPYLHEKKKTHMRCITLIIIHPDGSREFFMYNKMRIFTAAEEFDDKRLLEGGDNSFMLLTNMHQNKKRFQENPENSKKKFSPSSCIYDAETSMDATSFNSMYSSTRRIHSIIYSIIGDHMECEPTDVSIYDDSCFHTMASDIAVDKQGRAYFLEMNNAMGYNAWSMDEISGFYNGIAGLVKSTSSPYSVVDTSMWNVLQV